MFSDSSCLDKFAAILVGCAVTGANLSGIPVPPGTGEAAAAAGGLYFWRKLKGRSSAETVVATFQKDLRANWEAWGETSSHATPEARASAGASFAQVLPFCTPDAAEIAGRNLDPAAVAALMLAKAEAAMPNAYGAANPDNGLARKFLERLTLNAYRHLLGQRAFIDEIVPALWREMLETGQRTEEKIDALPEKIDRIVREALARESIGLTLKAARNIVSHYPGEEFPDTPEEIERLLVAKAKESQLLRERLAELDNSADLVIRDLLREASDLIETGDYAAAEARLVSAESHADEVRARIRANRGDLAKLRLNYREAAEHYAATAGIVAGDAEVCWRYESHRAGALYDLGNEYGDNAALIEAIRLFRETGLPLAPRTERPQHWATTQMNLGNALQALGERETGTGRLEQAVDAFRAALEERTRERVPLDWAMTQMNLGNALQTLGARGTGTGRLEQAVDAFRAALEEHTRERVPLDWAMTQMNLGNALRTLGARETGTGRLEEAVIAYRAALEEFTRERVPLQWAMTQSNLGNALRTLGERETGTERLEQAVAAFRAALEERTRERVPLDWAMTQGNLGNAHIALLEKTAEPHYLDTAEGDVEDALAVFREAGADHYIGMAENQLADIARLRAGG